MPTKRHLGCSKRRDECAADSEVAEAHHSTTLRDVLDRCGISPPESGQLVFPRGLPM